MASVIAEVDREKASKGSNPLRRVRIIGKIRGFTDQESQSRTEDSQKWITVKKSQENDSSLKATVSFESQSSSRKDSYDLDYCYEQDEGTELIYSREIQPMILEVLNGRNASVIALGARGSGKTYTIQGSQEKPGLALMATSEILSKGMELGMSVSVSLYEVIKEHAYDMLDPKHPEVQILEDNRGKIHFKGLSQVPVKSIQDFHNIYLSPGNSQKSVQKMPTEETRSHKGLMIHISSEDDSLKTKFTSKMNFVDLAGYEDPRKDGTIFTENGRTNKSFYTLLNVVYAINTNEKRVPYRESKLTRMLQDSLGVTSHVLMVTCLNPSFCQDSICSISLVSMSSRNVKQVLTDSTNRSLGKVKVALSVKTGKTPSTSLIKKKQNASSVLMSRKQGSSILRERKVVEGEKSTNSKQLRTPYQDTSARKSKLLSVALDVVPFSLEQDKSISDVNLAVEPKEDDPPLPLPQNDTAIVLAEKHASPDSPSGNLDAASGIELIQGHLGEENVPSKNKDGSPSLTERIREISNNLKALRSSTPSGVNLLDNAITTPYRGQIDPKTPVTARAIGTYHSPRGTFGDRSTEVKHTLVREYLNFLNSGSKEELKGLKGIGEKRATYILQLREESPKPFKQLDDLQEIGLSAKQVKGMMRQVASQLFN